MVKSKLKREQGRLNFLVKDLEQVDGFYGFVEPKMKRK
jgi:hypothetical protein